MFDKVLILPILLSCLYGCSGMQKKTERLILKEDSIKILPYRKKHELDIALPFKNNKYIVPENLEEAINWVVSGLPKDFINQPKDNKHNEGLGWKKYPVSSIYRLENHLQSSWNLLDKTISTKICGKEKINLKFKNGMRCDYIIMECVMEKVVNNLCYDKNI